MSQQYIGIDLAWTENNNSGLALLEDNKILYCGIAKNLEEVIAFIKRYPKAIIGVDAPLEVPNETGNRDIEKEFLKDFSSKRLGVYPVNRNLLTKYSKNIVGEELRAPISQKLGENLFEVYPHATILECFHGKVLEYKRKKGRDTAFIKKQLHILENYLEEVLDGEFKEELKNLKGKGLKAYEDKLDALVCAYTLFFCKNNQHKTYGGIFKVPIAICN